MSSRFRTSTIPTVKAALVALAKDALAVPGFETVEVEYGRGRDIPRESLLIGGTVQPEEQRWAVICNRGREERYSLELFVRITNPGDTQQESTERAFDVFGLIELALRENPTLEVPGVIQASIAQPELLEGVYDDEGFAAVIESGVAIQARI